jgi:CheY-like chemotaxis protein
MQTVLVVDDNETNLKLARIVLEEADFEVLVAESAEEARRLLGLYTVQVVLMDVQMPVTNGLELTRELRADPRFADLPIVALTAAAMKGDEERARAAGCNGYITKPIDTRTLPATVRSFIKE